MSADNPKIGSNIEELEEWQNRYRLRVGDYRVLYEFLVPFLAVYHKDHHMPFSAQDMFVLVADVAAYANFLPWCQRSHIVEQEGDWIIADLDIGVRHKLYFKLFGQQTDNLCWCQS